MTISAQRRREVIDALRHGTVPQRSLDAFAVGMQQFESTLDDELALVKSDGSVFNRFDRQLVIARNVVDGLAGIDALEDAARRHERPSHDRTSEGDPRVDQDRLLVRALGENERIEANGRMQLAPLDPLEVVLED